VALFRYDESGHRSQYVDADARLDPEGEEIWLFFFPPSDARRGRGAPRRGSPSGRMGEKLPELRSEDTHDPERTPRA